MEIFQKIVVIVGVITLIISTIWIYKNRTDNLPINKLFPIVSIYLLSSYYDIHMDIISLEKLYVLIYSYQIVFPLSSILICIYNKNSLRVIIISIILSISVTHFFDTTTILDILTPNAIIYIILGLLSVVVLSIKMLQNIRDVSEVNLLYFLLASFSLLSTISIAVLNQTIVFEYISWIQYMWLFLSYLFLIRIFIIIILINAIRR